MTPPRRTHRPPELFVQVPVDFADSASVDRARTVLGLSTHEAIGVFLLLFAATLKARCGGRIMERSDAWIEEAARWRGKPGALAKFVREHLADEEDATLLRGYLERYGALELKWAADAKRKRVVRRSVTSSAAADADADGVREDSDDSPRTVRGQSVDCPSPPYSSSSSSSSVVSSDKQVVLATTPGESAERGPDERPAKAPDQWAAATFRAPHTEFVSRLLRSVRVPGAVAAVLGELMDSAVTADPYTPDEIGRAVMEYLASDVRSPGAFNAAHFRGFVRRVRRTAGDRAQANSHDRHTVREVRLEREAAASRERAAREEQDADSLVARYREQQPAEYERIASAVQREAAGLPEGPMRDQVILGALRSRVAAAARTHQAPTPAGGVHAAA